MIYQGNSMDAEGTSEAKDLFQHVCHAGSYAVEAFWCPDTTNMIVVGLQKGTSLLLSSASYIIALVENFTDFAHHLDHEISSGVNQETAREIVLRYAKYFHRHYYCKAKLQITGSQEYYEWFSTHVMPFRNNRDGTTSLAPFYSPNETIVDWAQSNLGHLEGEVTNIIANYWPV
jgi:hypothetical protein